MADDDRAAGPHARGAAPVLGYARPGGVRPMSAGELRAWRLTRRLVVVAAFVCAGVWFVRDEPASPVKRLLLATAMVVLGLTVPLKQLTHGNARGQIRRELRTALFVVAFVASVAALVGLAFLLTGMFGDHAARR